MKEVFKKYTEGTPAEKKAMLKAYGEKQLKVLVENVLSEQWIKNESKQCPHCKVPIEVNKKLDWLEGFIKLNLKLN